MEQWIKEVMGSNTLELKSVSFSPLKIYYSELNWNVLSKILN
jgi:hypothetical protein